MRAFSAPAALSLLRQHRATVTGHSAPIALSDAEAAKVLLARLSRMNRRMGGTG
ncbi:hypothetical protein Q4F19_05290 [Sphingomonas sp. BIUV-7]|uniref:Uncharacterized protein n=1 Tax=Sphingomonas natans TaxID=3063330 RepID=A0ABT8Y7A5_9SPHN|nr:hypothetical protein [Sphingomonas sp. BIUV-7]MDO6413788.1 hypothetical protein [Sphingomonas sp. BIUV-7]